MWIAEAQAEASHKKIRIAFEQGVRGRSPRNDFTTAARRTTCTRGLAAAVFFHGVCRRVDKLQLTNGYLCLDLRSPQIGMAEHVLDVSYIGGRYVQYVIRFPVGNMTFQKYKVFVNGSVQSQPARKRMYRAYAAISDGSRPVIYLIIDVGSLEHRVFLIFIAFPL